MYRNRSYTTEQLYLHTTFDVEYGKFKYSFTNSENMLNVGDYVEVSNELMDTYYPNPYTDFKYKPLNTYPYQSFIQNNTIAELPTKTNYRIVNIIDKHITLDINSDIVFNFYNHKFSYGDMIFYKVATVENVNTGGRFDTLLLNCVKMYKISILECDKLRSSVSSSYDEFEVEDLRTCVYSLIDVIEDMYKQILKLKN